MKLFHLVFLLLFLSHFCLAQVNPLSLDSTKVYSVAELEQVPEYKGGVEALAKFIRQSIVYPKEAAKAKEGGLVIVSVLIDKQGKVSNAQIIQSAVKTITATSRQDLNVEAIRVML